MRSDQSAWNRQRRKDKGWPPPGLRQGVEAAQLGRGFEDVHLGEATRRFLVILLHVAVVSPTPFIEETILSPLYVFCSFVLN